MDLHELVEERYTHIVANLMALVPYSSKFTKPLLNFRKAIKKAVVADPDEAIDFVERAINDIINVVLEDEEVVKDLLFRIYKEDWYGESMGGSPDLRDFPYYYLWEELTDGGTLNFE